ncbi:MAG: hypothetical protein PUE95_07465 [Lachnospiraceae bacterium]|nr:hypothetical protein [Lachnospiraceae bacterium]
MNSDFLKQLGIEDENPKIVLQKLGKESTDLLNKKMYLETNGDEDAIKELEELYAKIQQEKEIVAVEAQNYVEPDIKIDEKAERKEVKRKQREQGSDIYKELTKKKQEEDKKKQRESAMLQQSGLDNVSTSQTSASSSAPSQSVNRNSVNSQSSVIKSAKNSSVASNGTATNPSSSSTANMTTKAPGDFSMGLRYYNKQDYSSAFSYLVKVAENKKPSDAVEEQERTQASHLLAIMYKNGFGTAVDMDRSTHYLRRAADFGFDKAQLEYGEYVLSEHITSAPQDLKARMNGLDYIEKAANSGNLEAQKKFVDYAMHSSDTNKQIIEKAKKMIPQLKTQLDSYEAQKCDDWLNELLVSEKNAKKRASYPKKFIIGEIVFLLGTIYLLKGMNTEFFEEVIPQVDKFIIDIPDWMIIKWKALIDYTDRFMTHQGIWGCWLIIIGNTVRGLGAERVKSYPGSKYQTFEKVINIAIIILCIMHFVANLIEGIGFFGNGGFAQFFVMMGSILIGRLLGVILFKIIK